MCILILTQGSFAILLVRRAPLVGRFPVILFPWLLGSVALGGVVDGVVDGLVDGMVDGTVMGTGSRGRFSVFFAELTVILMRFTKNVRNACDINYDKTLKLQNE